MLLGHFYILPSYLMELICLSGSHLLSQDLDELQHAQPQPEAHGSPQDSQVGVPVPGRGFLDGHQRIKGDGQVAPVPRSHPLRYFRPCDPGLQTWIDLTDYFIVI